MYNLILLSGNAEQNKEWIEDIRNKINPLFETSKILYYKHWAENKPYIEFQYEQLQLKKISDGISNLVIFAKSVGSVLTIKSVMEGIIKPEKCIFVGVPLLWAKDRDMDLATWIKNYNIPTLFIQQENDPYLSYSDLEKFLNKSSVSKYKLEKVVGNNHNYDDLDTIYKLVKDFING